MKWLISLLLIILPLSLFAGQGMGPGPGVKAYAAATTSQDFGDKTTTTSDVRNISNYLRCIHATVPSGCTAMDSVSAYLGLDYGSYYKARGAVYLTSDSSLISSSSEVNTTTSQDGIWVTFPLSGSVTQGTEVNLCVWGTLSNGIIYAMKDGTGTSYYAAQTYDSSSLPTSPQTFGTAGSERYVIYGTCH